MSIVLDALKKVSSSEEREGSDEVAKEVFFQVPQSAVSRRFMGLGLLMSLLFVGVGLFFLDRDGQQAPIAEKMPAAPPVVSTSQPAEKRSEAGSFDAWSEEGVRLYKANQYDLSVQSLQKAVSKNPRSAIAQNNLGLALKKAGRFEEAKASYQKALSIDPDYVEAMNNLAVWSEEKGMGREADALFQKILQKNARFAPAQLNYGVFLERQGDVDHAKSHYQAFLSLMPESDSQASRIREHLRQLP